MNLHESSKASGKSFTKIRNGKGPSTEPWGTPDFISFSVEINLPNFVICFLLLKYDSGKLVGTRC